MAAASQGHNDIVNYLLDATVQEVNAADSLNLTAIFYATLSNDISTYVTLAQYGADTTPQLG